MILDVIFYMWDAVTEFLVAWTPKILPRDPTWSLRWSMLPPPPLPRIINEYRRILGVTL